MKVNKELILKLHSGGKTCQEIRDSLGYSLTTIRKYIKESGNETNSKITKINDIILDNISKLLDLNKTNTEIAKELKLSPTTVRKYTTEILKRPTNSTKIKSIKNKELVLTSE